MYIGRFAPTPSGPLHFGSLIAALASFLDARAHNGRWLVRIEDLDPPRCMPGAADTILRQLEAHGLEWDGEVVHQSTRTESYREALETLRRLGLAYPCTCSRAAIRAQSSRMGCEGPIYPGTCRPHPPLARETLNKAIHGLIQRASSQCTPRTDSAHQETSPLFALGHPAPNGKRPFLQRFPSRQYAMRLDTRGAVIDFTDRLHGRIQQDLENALGDFVIWRVEDIASYHLAVVVDDAWQEVTSVVRGADLLASTPRQILLQRLLGLPTPSYLHLPLALAPNGQKLSKQNLAPALTPQDASRALVSALRFLGQAPDMALTTAQPAEILAWAIPRWRPEAIPRNHGMDADHA